MDSLKSLSLGFRQMREPSAAAWQNWIEYIQGKTKSLASTLKKNASQALANTLSKKTGVKLDVLNPLKA